MTKTNDEDLTQYHLTAPGCSRKGIRVRALSATDMDAALEAAAKLLSPDATPVQIARTENRMGAEAMLVEVSKAPSDSAEALLTAAWEPFDPNARRPQLNAKDWNVLMSIYVRTYSVSRSELDDIMGKALPVAAG